MATLDATDAEVGELIGRSPEQIEAMRKGDTEIDAETRILLRPFLADDPHAGGLALEKLRNTQVRDLRGDGAEKAGIEDVPHAGGFTGATGGGWS
jgi:hypothetical protein